MKVEAGIALAHGGTLTLSINPRPDGSINEAEVQPFLDLGGWIRERMSLFGPSTPISDVAVLWAEESYRAASLEIMARVELLSGDQSMQGLHRALVGDHAQFDIVRAQIADLNTYQVVVLPESFLVTGDTEQRLRDYVAGGGTLVVLRSPSDSEETTDRPETRLADVIGVEPADGIDEDTCYVRLDDAELSRDLPDIPLMMRGTVFGCRPTTAAPLAHFVRQLAPRTRNEYVWPTAYNPPGPESHLPAITVNRYGAGMCFLVAFPLAINAARRATLDPSPRVLLANLVRLATPAPFMRTNAPLLVETIANRTPDGGAIVHLVNWYAGVEGNYCLEDALPGVADIRLEIDKGRLPSRFLVTDGAGKTLSTSVNSGALTVDLPVLRDHVAVQILPIP